MSTGPEHYRDAERLLAKSQNDYVDDPAAALTLHEAQVHATLALAAATVLGARMNNGLSAVDGAAWDAATTPKRGGR